MMSLLVGADRDRFRALLYSDGTVEIHWTVEEPVAERNDAALLAKFLTVQPELSTAIDQFVLLVPPHSATTVRVVGTLLGVLAWQLDRPLIPLSVGEIQTVDGGNLSTKVTLPSTRFSPSVLAELP